MAYEYEELPLEEPAQFLYWLENYLISVLKPGEIEPIMQQERARIEAGGLPQDSIYWPNVVYHHLQFQQATQAEEPTGITGGYETQIVAGNTLAILRDNDGNVIDTINLGATETGAITPYQQAELDYMNQQYQTQRMQWAVETAMEQWQTQQQLAAQQQQLGYQASSEQAGLNLQAQLAALPYQGMTVADQAQMDLQRRQYLAEMMANPTRWIEGYYAQEQQQPPWTTTATTMPQIQTPQIQVPQMQAPEYPPWFGPQTLEDLLAQLLPQPEVPPAPLPTPTQQLVTAYKSHGYPITETQAGTKLKEAAWKASGEY